MFGLVMLREWKKSRIEREREFSKFKNPRTRKSRISRLQIFENRERRDLEKSLSSEKFSRSRIFDKVATVNTVVKYYLKLKNKVFNVIT